MNPRDNLLVSIATPRMPQPVLTIDATLRVLRVIHSALLISMFLYAFVAEKVLLHQAKSIDRVFFNSIAVVAIAAVGAAFVVRAQMIGPALERLRTNPSDTNAMGRWRTGFIIADTLVETTVLFGFVLRAIGASSTSVLPFYIAGPTLMLLWWPRRP